MGTARRTWPIMMVWSPPRTRWCSVHTSWTRQPRHDRQAVQPFPAHGSSALRRSGQPACQVGLAGRQDAHREPARCPERGVGTAGACQTEQHQRRVQGQRRERADRHFTRSAVLVDDGGHGRHVGHRVAEPDLAGWIETGAGADASHRPGQELFDLRDDQVW
jgi:hypothetical protein